MMKQITQIATIGCAIILLAACSSSNDLGSKVKDPFSSSKYDSDKRHFRAVGQGASKDENIAKNKADLQAKKELAQQVQTRLKIVTDQYLSETQVDEASSINDKFESLTREVTNTQIADLRKIGEEKYFNGEKYTVFIVYEIQKKQMLRFMKKKAKTEAEITKKQLKAIEGIIDQELLDLN
ncbi:MAG: hypothetical protein ACI9RU_002186 [Litorivivens sp.]|jgi:hypothetical protein